MSQCKGCGGKDIVAQYRPVQSPDEPAFIIYRCGACHQEGLKPFGDLVAPCQRCHCGEVDYTLQPSYEIQIPSQIWKQCRACTLTSPVF